MLNKIAHSNTKILALLGFGLILLIFGYFYSNTILSLPLFGDATGYGLVTKKILQNGIFNSKSTYPPLYNLIQLVLYKLFGEVGMNMMTLLGLLLLSISTLLFIFELYGEYFLSLLSVIFVLASPKIIFYSSRMYIEIFLSGMFVLSIYQLLVYLKKQNLPALILLGIFTAFTASVKQQGLMILFTSISAFLFIISTRTSNKTLNFGLS